MDIKFERDGIIKTTHVKFTDDLLAVGWKVVEEPKPKKITKKKKTKKAE